VRNVVKVNYFVLFLITVLYLFFPNEFTTFLGRDLFSIEWIPSMKVRLTAYFEYATLLGQFILFTYPILFLKQQRYGENIFITLFLVFCAYLTGARIFLICMIILLGYLLLEIIINKFNLKITKKAVFLIIIGIILLLVCFSYKVESIINYIIHYRFQSSSTRLTVYYESIRAILDGNFLIGQGIRVPSSVGIFLGSHSSYISIFYRTSFTGLFLFFSILLFLYREAIKQNRIIYKLFFGLLLLYMVFEEFDPNHWSVVLLFTTLGIVGRGNDKKTS
ncbi:TPA: capsule biosynthesis protein CapK, partial [Streptococcus agalactiae]|nr:capsule biosynthesis protein CapK [Streptococcus agalactiae]